MSQVLSRRGLIGAGGMFALSGLLPAVAHAAAAGSGSAAKPLEDYDPVRTELVMNLFVTCSDPEPMVPGTAAGAAVKAKDGGRAEFWPIIGGWFEGPRLKGRVVPGGADFPVIRPDGVEVVDAFYRLREDDGSIIIIHNIGIAYTPIPGQQYRYRLSPSFTVAEGKHDWLNKSLFIATLLADNDMPKQFVRPARPGENDRLIQVHRVV
ncbi:DUF3237 domain-containing protein [Niveispirillum sp. BGYR6]|uniref:DUF3237 domain-containing protein n=1 Tax=Niveispirillum sp. BGYR6 TaxID=2971249 RepID=UPI0022B947FF|nr:DUF3237 domain-containing protein [Niveispirillum sp. BGYR6]MDG5494005.1 DUF3237 domain-containing protein [Niveispirillum sp. BGYR6]